MHNNKFKSKGRDIFRIMNLISKIVMSLVIIIILVNE